MAPVKVLALKFKLLPAHRGLVPEAKAVGALVTTIKADTAFTVEPFTFAAVRAT